MKILWCTHSMAGFRPDTGGYNGCGWITSLLDEFKKESDVEIGVAFYYSQKIGSIKQDGITFFPIYQGHIGLWDKAKTFFGDISGWLKEEKKHISDLKSIIDIFTPDVIHVWGTETDMGLIAKEVKQPVIIHLQGLLHPYNNMLCPPGFSKLDYIRKDGLSPKKLMGNLNGLNYWNYKAERETRIFASCNNYFGRTHWDKAICKFFVSNSKYFYCGEMLREDFYSGERWKKQMNKTFYIVSTISAPLYKGMDMVLKTAHLLKDYGHIDFVWNIVGVDQVSFIEKKTGIRSVDVNVRLLGVKKASEIKELELKSDLYFHPSYIDNSPNSICEAQMLGMPIIAVNVGGVSTLIENNKSGWLVPSNEPHLAASMIIDVYNGVTTINNKFVMETANKRHCKNTIITDIKNCYKKLKE